MALKISLTRNDEQINIPVSLNEVYIVGVLLGPPSNIHVPYTL